MQSNYKRLGDYIRQVDVRNRDLVVTELLGLSIAKNFIPSIANTIGTDMSSYKIVEPHQFGYVPVTSRNGNKITIALYDGKTPCVISQAYTVFEVIDENMLLPEYLMMWFRRPEFDRFARFKSHGSAREIFDWETMCEVKLPVPSIEEQRKIVAEYQAIERRIENNRKLIAKLEETAQTIYRQRFVDNIDPENLPQGWRIGSIGDFGKVITGKTPSLSNPEDFGKDIDFLTPGEFKDNDIFYSDPIRKLSTNGAHKLKNKLIPRLGIAITCIGSDMGKVRICQRECISNQQINSVICNDINANEYLFFTLRSMKMKLQELAVGSSTMPMLSKSEFENVKILIPSYANLKAFRKLTFWILDYIFSIEKENRTLSQFLSILLSKLSKLN